MYSYVLYYNIEKSGFNAVSASLVPPSYDPRGKNENSESLLHIYKTCPIISYSINFYFWKRRCSSSDKVYRKQEKSFFDPHLTPRGKMKIPKLYCAATGHAQSSLRISLVFFLKCWWSLSDKTTLENVIFRPLFDPMGQNENFKTLLRIYKTRPTRS